MSVALGKRARSVTLSAFSVVGFIDLIGRFLLVPLMGTFFGQAVTKPIWFDQVASLSAPNGKEKAVLFASAPPGSGCNEFLSVVRSDTPDRIAWQERHWVFITQCRDQLQFSWEPPADGRVRPRLRVNAEAASGDLMRRFALEGTVAVAYRGDP